MSAFFRCKRKLVFFIALCFWLSFAACSCIHTQGGKFSDKFRTYDCFSVNFLDVGEGDAIFINFNDGKTMLIDCAEKSERNLETIEKYLDAYAADSLDYLILTHPDGDHVGNAAEILDTYSVKTAFIPDLKEPEKFNAYYPSYIKIKEKGIDKVSATGNVICGEDYTMVFLSPDAKGTTGSAYDAVNSSVAPSADDINDLSPIIYLDYEGIRFVFTGDAGFSQEETAIDNVETGLIKRYLKRAGREDANLTDVDFLKVAHHGAADASGSEFLQMLTPQNAVISVGGDNSYGHPKQETLNRIMDANEYCNVYLTSEKGTVSVLVDENGQVSVKTDADAA